MLDRVRLHISPLTPELLPVVLPPSVLVSASDVSYHALQTFPERNYGYVELPAAEAQKLKKKLHGAILRGSKMKIEEARPKRKGKAATEDADGTEPEVEKKSATRPKKRKREEGVLSGFELPGERKVKRGWTEPIAPAKATKSKKAEKGRKGEKEKKRKVEPSKFTDGPECLFKTKVPPNAAEIPKVTPTTEEKVQKKKGKGMAGETVIHEFSGTTKHPSFLRGSKNSEGKKTASNYVDGKGWVDQDGNVVEEGPKSRRPQRKQPTSEVPMKEASKASKSRPKKPVAILKDGSPITPDSSSESVSDSEDTSSSGTSSSEDEDESDDESDEESATSVSNNIKSAAPLRIPIRDSTPAGNTPIEKPASPSTSPSINELDKDTPDSPALTAAAQESKREREREIHPLEALFKKPKAQPSSSKKPNLEVRTSFSFFDPDAEDAEDSGDIVHPALPQTPFTQRDYLSRRQRSAAPTPDTAAPSKIGFGPLWRGVGGEGDSSEHDEDDGEGQEEYEKAKKSSVGKNREGSSPGPSGEGKDASGGGGGPPSQQSDFAKWFWEHRGETNRAWKRRKREAAKEKRHKENQEREKNVV
ncbi:MAG: hypothetical protein MMC33_005683 [Icmadophila ericetorum]|nr:hypothetical protein [Icmadophila ericetorum]